jgi:putative serine protease PepD
MRQAWYLGRHMTSQGPWPSSADRPPPPAPGGPGSDAAGNPPAGTPGAAERGPGNPGPGNPGPGNLAAGDLAAGDLGPGAGDREPDYALPPDPFRRGADREPRDPDRPAPDRAGPGRRRADGRLGGVSRRLVVAVAAIALASALVGGLLGGYVVTRAQNATDPGYSLGPVPRAATQRTAGSVASLAARILPSVVMIRVDGSQGTGSGFVIRGGYIVTDNHVVTLDGTATSTSLQVVLPGGQVVPARLVGRDTYSDIAVIRPAGNVRLPALPLGNSAGVAVGDQVIAFGAPLGLAGTVTSGIVSALNRPVQPGAGNGPAAPQVYLDAIQTDAPINPGNSGGPLVNRQGQVIGVNAAFDTLGGNLITGQGGSIGLGFAIPINEAARVAAELIRTGHATHAVIGAALNFGYAGAGAQLSAPSARRPSVTPGGPAARAGLRPGDVIVSFAGQPVASAAALLDAIRAQPPGARVPVTYLSGGQSRTATLRLGSAGS